MRRAPICDPLLQYKAIVALSIENGILLDVHLSLTTTLKIILKPGKLFLKYGSLILDTI